MLREYPRPVRNEMIPCEGYVRVTAGDHLRKIAMHDAKATWEAHLSRDQSISCGLPKQLFCGGKALRTNITWARQRDARTCAYRVSQAMNAEWIALTDQ